MPLNDVEIRLPQSVLGRLFKYAKRERVPVGVLVSRAIDWYYHVIEGKPLWKGHMKSERYAARKAVSYLVEAEASVSDMLHDEVFTPEEADTYKTLLIQAQQKIRERVPNLFTESPGNGQVHLGGRGVGDGGESGGVEASPAPDTSGSE
jgi:hypothetical protein